jgi:hypothetical protein
MDMLPDAAPEADGANFATSVAEFPAVIFAGSVKPLMLKPVPEALAAEIVRVALPEFVRVMFCVVLLPTLTFPKLTLAGLIVSCG